MGQARLLETQQVAVIRAAVAELADHGGQQGSLYRSVGFEVDYTGYAAHGKLSSE
jgi:hypothetical protein